MSIKVEVALGVDTERVLVLWGGERILPGLGKKNNNNNKKSEILRSEK